MSNNNPQQHGNQQQRPAAVHAAPNTGSIQRETPVRATRRVTVHCNIPNGIVLRVFEKSIYQVGVLGGGVRDVTEWSNEIGRAIVRGPAKPNSNDRSFVQPILDGNGYAMTQIDAEIWDNWLEHNRASLAVVNRCLYAEENFDTAGDKAFRDVLSGLHPLEVGDGNKDARMPHSRRADIVAGNGSRAAA